MPLGLLDLSLVTDRLIDRLKDWKTASDLWKEDKDRAPGTPVFPIDFTGLAPDVARSLKGDESDCHVSVYLFHVSADKHNRNTFPLGGSAQRTPPQPFALNLYYLLTAYSKTSYIHEQQAMSVALKCFHENPIVSLKVPDDTKREETFTLTIEPETVDEIGRLWQAINAPLRLSAVYRVGVVFLEAPPPAEVKAVRHDPGFLDYSQIVVTADFSGDAGPDGDVGIATTDAAGLATIRIAGAHFGPTTVVKLRAQALDLTTDPPAGGQFRVILTGSPLAPDTLAVRVPLFTPQGLYAVTVTPAPDAPQLRFSLEVPQRIVVVAADAARLATIAAYDAGFKAGVTEVWIGSSPLTRLAPGGSPLAPGQFRILPGGNALRLQAPLGTPVGRTFVKVNRGPDVTPFELWLDVPAPTSPP